jgi:hypothetical protein
MYFPARRKVANFNVRDAHHGRDVTPKWCPGDYPLAIAEPLRFIPAPVSPLFLLGRFPKQKCFLTIEKFGSARSAASPPPAEIYLFLMGV